ncbi:MAG: fibrobacter succinogenes major paralogous domain-containing protein, partial [Bacteroidales bacterium]|nr:fibrobacter succinogenes major paralogous domain-containing protein [Bacteroidales bacterium]
NSYTPKYYGYSVRCVKGPGVLAACTDTLMEQTVNITYGTSYSWRGRTLTDGGVYYDSLTRVNGGCDSIYKLVLLVNCGTVTDVDNNTYNTIQIGAQCWMRENLKTTRYANGVAIPMGATETYSNIAYRFYPNKSSSNVSTYGYLYNWRAVMGNSPSSSGNPSGVQGICPTGWHVPSSAEWMELTNYVTNHPNYTYSSTATYIAKALASQSYWSNAGNNGNYYVGDLSYPNNTTGFEARPAGCLSGNYAYDFSSYAYFWSTTQYNSSNSYYRGLYYRSETVVNSYTPKYYGYSVRCVKD